MIVLGGICAPRGARGGYGTGVANRCFMAEAEAGVLSAERAPAKAGCRAIQDRL